MEQRKMEARILCQTNLYLHYLLKQEGLKGELRLDQDIGTHFCDLSKMNKY